MVRDGRYVDVVGGWMSCEGRNGIVDMVGMSRVGRG